VKLVKTLSSAGAELNDVLTTSGDALNNSSFEVG